MNKITHVMSFGEGLEKLEEGKKLTRLAWDSDSVFIYLVPAASYPIQRNINNTLAGVFENDMAPYPSYIAMKTLYDGVTPWTPTQFDMFTKDWIIID